VYFFQSVFKLFFKSLSNYCYHTLSHSLRLNTEVKVYTYSKDYMAAVAIAMLGAQKEILITSWKNSPGG
jgi:hypothetical protein